MIKSKIPKSVQQPTEDKWESLSQGKEPKSYDCLYCPYFEGCEDCSLYPDICPAYIDSFSLYKQWVNERNKNGISTDVAKKLASQILEAVKERAEVIDD